MTKKEKIDYLIAQAQGMMYMSDDPVHDIFHVKRVVVHCERMSEVHNLSSEQHASLLLAAWWHDTSRLLTRKPSFIVMPLIDDLLSALLLWRETIRCGLFGSIAGMATRIIFCKSFGAGRLLTRVLFRSRNRVMIDILKDADTLDLLHTERMGHLLDIAEESVWYERGYKFMVWWFLRNKQLHMNTIDARTQIVDAVEEFLCWIHTPEVWLWHVERFGEHWVEKNTSAGHILIERILLTVPSSHSLS